MVKKVQNSSISGTVTKSAEKVESKEPVETIAATTTVTTDSETDLVFGNGSSFEPKEKEGRREWVNNITDKPILSIGGKSIELTKFEHSVPFHSRKMRWDGDLAKNNILAVKSGTDYRSLPYSNEILDAETAEWYSAEVNGVKFILTQGSQVIVTESVSVGNDWEYHWEEEGEKEAQPTLTLIGGLLEAKMLHVISKSSLNNSHIVGGYVQLHQCKLAASRVSSNDSVVITKTGITDSHIGDAKEIIIKDSGLNNWSVLGSGRLVVSNAKSWSSRFQLSLYSRKNIDLTIDGRVAEHAGHHSVGNTENIPCGKHDSNGVLRINRRTDYGHFSSVQPVPFVRLNSFDILVEGTAFTAKEFFPEYFTQPQKEPDTTAPAPIGFGYNPSWNPSPQPSWIKEERGGVLWGKAAAIVFPNEPVIGKHGDEMVKSLLSQIRSRVGLFVELHNLKE